MHTSREDQWLFIISSKRKLLDFNFKEVWQYRDLLMLFVRRNIVTVYKQTVLGPLWYFIQPLFTSVIFTLVFNSIAKISTGDVPPYLFQLGGITAWNYFKVCLTGTSNTFRGNAGIFGKVYFPRIIMPLSVTITNLFRFGIQLLIFIGFYFYYVSIGYDMSPNSNIILFPVYVLMMALLGLGLGMTISAFTTKYRDLSIIVSFATSLLMYISAVPFSLSEIIKEKPEYVWVFQYNPVTHIIEGFRYMFLNIGVFTWTSFFYTLTCSILIFLVGIIVFNKTEKNFIDTV